MPALEKRLVALRLTLDQLSSELDRLDYLISIAMAAHQRVDESLRRPEFEIAGCASRLWVRVTAREGLLHIDCDSDSVILRGLAIMVSEVYEGLTPWEAREVFADPLQGLELAEDLNDLRRESLHKVMARIRNTP